jgi:hypothetical protein
MSADARKVVESIGGHRFKVRQSGSDVLLVWTDTDDALFDPQDALQLAHMLIDVALAAMVAQP